MRSHQPWSQEEMQRAHRRSVFLFWVILLLIVLWWGWNMFIRMPGKTYSGSQPQLTQAQQKIRDQLQIYVKHLATTIGERNMWRFNNLNAAANYIENSFKAMGYSVKDQTYLLREKTVRNIEVEIPGGSQSNQIIIIGAHYDTVFGSPGADDNASGVAALLELARLFKNSKPQRTLRFVAFVNEEPPFFLSNNMGSYIYAKRAREKNENIVGMISLESLGYYSDIEGSQKYPFFLGFFYPSVANFIGFVSNIRSKGLLVASIKAFRDHAQFPSEGIAAPMFVPGVSWSDQWSFWRFGYPAIMVTDTAPYRYAYYHTHQDTPEKLNYTKMMLVLDGLKHVINSLAVVAQSEVRS